jgi:hypothetical protein
MAFEAELLGRWGNHTLSKTLVATGFCLYRAPFGIADLAFSYCFGRFFVPLPSALKSADFHLIQAGISLQIAEGLCLQVSF